MFPFGHQLHLVLQLRAAEARPYYKRVLEQFPTSSRYWNLYFKHEFDEHNYEEAKTIFQPTTFREASTPNLFGSRALLG
jgi:hypothetical protein